MTRPNSTFGDQPKHGFALGYLRLLFASMVIVSHTPEIMDGNRSREPLTQLFGTLSFGELAVNAFFIISGFLITGSYLRSSLRTYMLHRIGRIYPAFLVMSAICVFVIAPMSGGVWEGFRYTAKMTAERAIMLTGPYVAGVFPGTHYPTLNGAAWTIAYEFRCYLLVVALGLLKAFRWPAFILFFAVTALLASFFVDAAAAGAFSTLHHRVAMVTGDLHEMLRLVGMYLAGSAFYLFRHRIQVSGVIAGAAVVGLIAGMFFPFSASIAVALCGTYLIFFVAVRAQKTWLSRVGVKNDVSYGLYLYAFPITKLLLLAWPAMPILAVGGVTLLAAYACGWASWLMIERPVMEWVKKKPLLLQSAPNQRLAPSTIGSDRTSPPSSTAR